MRGDEADGVRGNVTTASRRRRWDWPYVGGNTNNISQAEYWGIHAGLRCIADISLSMQQALEALSRVLGNNAVTTPRRWYDKFVQLEATLLYWKRGISTKHISSCLLALQTVYRPTTWCSIAFILDLIFYPVSKTVDTIFYHWHPQYAFTSLDSCCHHSCWSCANRQMWAIQLYNTLEYWPIAADVPQPDKLKCGSVMVCAYTEDLIEDWTEGAEGTTEG